MLDIDIDVDVDVDVFTSFSAAIFANRMFLELLLIIFQHKIINPWKTFHRVCIPPTAGWN